MATEPPVGTITRHDAHLLALRLLVEQAESLIDGMAAVLVMAYSGRPLTEAELAVVVHFLTKERDRLLETIARHEAQQ